MSDKTINVLLIEDNPADADFIQEVLADVMMVNPDSPSFVLECVNRLSTGLERLAQEGIDVLLLDLSLPDSYGLDTFVEAHARAPRTPIIVLSGLEDKTLATEAVQRGAQNYLVKGQVSGSLLVRAIQYAIEHKRTEEALRESEKKYRTLFETMVQGVIYQAADGRITSANPAAERILGLPLDQMQGRTPTAPHWKTIRKDSSGFSGEMHPSMVALKTGKEVRNVVTGVFNPQQGEYRWININTVPQFKPGESKPYQIYTTFDDVTERVRAEEALRYRVETESLVAAISTHLVGLSSDEVNDGINWALQAAGQFAGVDRSYVFLFSGDRTKMSNTHEWCAEGIVPQIENLQGLPVEAFPWWIERLNRFEDIRIPRVVELPPEASAEKEALGAQGTQSLVIAPMVRGRSLVGYLGFSSVRSERTWVEEDIALLRRIGETITDTLERKRAEEALRESERKFRSVVEQASDGILLTDERGSIIEWNQAQEQITGMKRAEVLGRPLWDTQSQVAPEERNRSNGATRERLAANVRGLLETGQAPWIHQLLEQPIRRPDGTRRIIQSVVFPIETEKGFIVGSVSRDVTEEKEAEEQIKRRNRELTTLNEVGRTITSTLDLQETLTLIADHTNRLMGMAATSVLLYDEVNDDLRFAAASGEGADFVVGQRLVPGQGIAGWVAQHGEPVLVPDVSQDPRWFEGFDTESDFTTRSILCVPLKSKGRVIGALEAINKKGGFTQDDLRLLSALAGPVAAAIENARLFEQVRTGREQLQALSRRLVNVQETERAYVSRELHDETGQALSSLLLGLSLLEQGEDRPEEVKDRVIEMEAMVDEMLENLHRLAMNLRPATLDHLGLIPALEQYIETFNQQHDIETQFEVVGLGDERLPPEVETALYRIVQESLTNVIRHAQATRVDVLVERRNDKIVTIIEDDGVGFDPEAAMLSSRLGLFGIRERAEMLDGDLVIESAAGTGTTVFVEVPYVHPSPSKEE